MIIIRHTFRGVCASAALMIPFYCILWLEGIGGVTGMMNDDSYPMSMVIVPLMGALISGAAFWLGIYPFVQLAKWMGNRWNWSWKQTTLIAIGISASLGPMLVFISGRGSVLYSSLFLGSSAAVFWWTTSRQKENASSSKSGLTD